MSIAYALFCLETGEMLALGKLSWEDGDSLGPRYSFGNLAYSEGGRDAADSRRDIRALIHFLLRNRTKSVVLLPENVFSRYTGTDFFPPNERTSIPGDDEEYALLFSSPLGRPDPYEDEKIVSQKVRQRLEELSRGEAIEKLPWDPPGT
jgi:hypothetical protein